MPRRAIATVSGASPHGGPIAIQPLSRSTSPHATLEESAVSSGVARGSSHFMPKSRTSSSAIEKGALACEQDCR